MSNIHPGPNNPFKAQLSYNLSEKTLSPAISGEKKVSSCNGILFSHLYMKLTEKANSYTDIDQWLPKVTEVGCKWA